MRRPTDQEVDFWLGIKILLGIMRLESNLPKIRRLTVHSVADKLASDKVGVQFLMPTEQIRRRRPPLAFGPGLSHPLVHKISWTQSDWGDTANLIAFDKEVADGFTVVHTSIDATLRELYDGINRPAEVHGRINNAPYYEALAP
jgi:hypothetical protein